LIGLTTWQIRPLKAEWLFSFGVESVPERTVSCAQGGTRATPTRTTALPLRETLEVLADLVRAGKVRAGKVRAVGISNETPWGTMRLLDLAEHHGLPRMASIQNPYSLLNRSFEIGLAEIALREDCGLLAYSPLAFGVLSGKYLEGRRPAGARLTLYERFSRYSNPESERATAEYVALAREHGLDPAQMALAWVTSRPFVTANIIGATRLAQLESNIGSAGLALSEEVIAGIEAIHQGQPNPAP
jgi:aryl-alcohol dehydrogenase-like predicted oxidoreductase